MWLLNSTSSYSVENLSDTRDDKSLPVYLQLTFSILITYTQFFVSSYFFSQTPVPLNYWWVLSLANKTSYFLPS